MECNNIDSENIDEEIGIKLRGDAVGDTMYSATFITKTLLKLSNIQWTSQLEEDLCFLWDMTLEEDVCQYLLDLSYPSLVTDLIKQNENNRLIEILIGILANIFSVIQDKSKFNVDTSVILEQLYSDDSLIIIQVMRFVKAVTFLFDKADFVDRDILNQMRFILRSSTCTDLLSNTLDALAKFTDDKLNKDIFSSEIITDLFTGLNEIKSKCDIGSLEVRYAYVHVMQIICNVCAYEGSSGNTFLNDIRSYSNQCVSEFSQILKYFSQEENLLPVPYELNFYADALSYIFEILIVREYPVIFESVCKVINILIKAEYEDIKSFMELFNTIITQGELNSLQDSASKISFEIFHNITKNTSYNNEMILEKLKKIEQRCKK